MNICLLLVLCLIGPLLGYFSGSILYAILLTKWLKSSDIRKFGSHNPGFTNTLRTFGIKFSTLILLLDMCKVILPTLIIYFSVYYIPSLKNSLNDLNFNHNNFNFSFLIYLTGIFAILGHIFPIFYKFKGGKGIASYFGLILLISPFIFLISCLCLILIVLIKKIMSLASIISISLSAILFLIPGVNYFYLVNSNFVATIDITINNFVLILPTFGLLLLIIILILYKHKTNIINLINKKEKKLSILG